MAMAIKWKMPFVSLDGTHYNLNICSNGYSGEAIMLTAGMEPFVTEEENSTDVLTPIRTQSGYINIVCERSTWFEIINEGDCVFLTEGGTVKWQGFINKEAFNGSVFEPVIEYQIPVHCILAHLKSYRFVLSPLDTPTFAQILHEAFGKMANCYPREMAWAEAFSSSNVPNFLGCRFQRSNFHNEEATKIDSVITSQSTYFDVISEMCKYFGITLRTLGDTLLFCDGDSDLYITASTQDLMLVEDNGASIVRITGAHEGVYSALANLDYVSNSSQESIVQPVKDITIKGGINRYDDFDGTYPKRTVDDWVDGHVSRVTYRDYDNIRHYTREFRVDLHPGETIGSYFQEFDQYENETVVMKLYRYMDSAGESPSHGSYIESKDEIELADVANKIDYDWKNFLNIKVQRSALMLPVLGLYSKRDIYLSGDSGAINLYYQASGAIPAPNYAKTEWRLSIGKHYWNGSRWMTQPSTFVVGWRQQNPAVECETNRTLGDGYDGYKGLVIPINMPLQGKMRLELIQMATGSSSVDIDLSDIHLKYINTLFVDDSYKDEVKVHLTTGADCIDEYTQECSFATSPDINGYGTVLTFNGVSLEQYDYGGRYMSPESYRAGIISFRMGEPRSCLDIDVSDASNLDRPWQLISASGGYPSYSVLSTSHKWRDSKLSVKLLQLV